MVWTLWISLGAGLAGLGVVIGAFGAHALKSRLPEEALTLVEIGVRYQMYHAFALIAVGLVATRVEGTLIKVAGLSFAGGIVIFSGSLYLLATTGARWLGMSAPIGGVAFIVGWVCLALSVR